MDSNFRKQVFTSMNLKETDELLDIWEQNNRFEWSELAFDVVREILLSRIGNVPPQGKPTNKPIDDSVKRRNRLDSEFYRTKSMVNYGGFNSTNSLVQQTSFSEKIGEKIVEIEKKYLKKQDALEIKFSRIGMFVTFLGASILGIFIGFVLYGTGTILGFHIPFIFPMLTSVLIAMPILDMGKNLGRCRNLSLAISVPVFASVLVWITEHFASSLLFHTDNSMPLTILKFGGAVLPITFTLSKFWATVYWIVELILLIGFTARINADYPFQPFCEKCNAWHRFKTPIAGTDAKLEQAINALRANDMPGLIESLEDEQGDNVVRFDIEFCPKCYADGARLVVVNKTEKNVWEGVLEPKYVQELMQNAI